MEEVVEDLAGEIDTEEEDSSHINVVMKTIISAFP